MALTLLMNVALCDDFIKLGMNARAIIHNAHNLQCTINQAKYESPRHHWLYSHEALLLTHDYHFKETLNVWIKWLLFFSCWYWLQFDVKKCHKVKSNSYVRLFQASNVEIPVLILKARASQIEALEVPPHPQPLLINFPNRWRNSSIF